MVPRPALAPAALALTLWLAGGASAEAPAPRIPTPAAMPAPLPEPARAPTAPQLAPMRAPTAPLPAPLPDPVKLSTDPQPAYSPATLALTQDAAERYGRIAAAGGWPVVPNDVTLLKPNDRSPALRHLRARLALVDDLPADAKTGDALDEPLTAAIRRFQARHGIEETGIVGPRTLVALNVPAEARLRQVQATIARIASSRFPFGERYVVVNIPSQTVEAVAGGSVARRHVAVVGKPDRASPQIETRITAVNFNPTWTVPTSLIKKDIIPHVRKDPGYLARMKIRLLDGTGHEVDPARIDWSTEAAANYTVRQDSGGENSLGEVRIDMPNRLAVYMHDTPSKRLFARTRRTQSSGCVRVADVKSFAGWILQGAAGPAGSPGWGATEIDAAIASGKRIDGKPPKPIPVAWVYLTGYATPDGIVQFRDDVYGLDEPKAPTLPAAAPPTSALPSPLPLPAGAARAPTIGDLVTGSVVPAR